MVIRPAAYRIGTLAAALLAVGVRAAPPPDVVGRVGDGVISREELDTRTADKLKEQEAKYMAQRHALEVNFERDKQDYLERSLGALLDERVLALEAHARRTTPEALLKALRPPEVSAETTRAYYDANRAENAPPYDRVAAQLTAYLARQSADKARREYLDALLKKYGAVSLLDPRREAVEATGPARGASAAPVTLVEFADFECPYCSRLEPVLQSVLKAYDGKVRLVYRNYPLADLHPHAQKAAEAAVCAQRQGKFWEMHDLLFAEQKALDVEALKEKARRLKLDEATFANCLDSGAATSTVHADQSAGEALAIMGTPATFINGRLESGVLTLEQFSSVIDDELARVARVATR